MRIEGVNQIASVKKPESIGRELNDFNTKTMQQDTNSRQNSEEEIIKAIEAANRHFEVYDKRLEFSIHEKTKEIIVKIVDSKNDEVIKEIPDQEKPGAYSWIKTPRYQDKPFEGGPLARLWINNIYNSGISVNDRNVARALEIKEIIKEMYIWLEELNLHQPSLNRYQPIPDTQGTGLIDSMRGPLGHWVKIKNGRTSHYQVVTPSSWNFAPRDKNNQRGPVEEALIGTPVADLNSLIEVGRVIRSFDPCFSCAVHVAKGDRSLGKYLI
jgi:Ni,Fe-hydrogenase I large subunit